MAPAAMEQCNVACVPAGYTLVPVMMMAPMTPSMPPGVMTPTGVMTPSGAMTPTYHKMDLRQSVHSNASTAVPSELQSQLHSEENSDDEDEGDCNEACAELISQLDAGGEARQAAVEALIGSVDDLAFDASACRVVQKALEMGESDEAVQLALELQGRVRDAIRSPHANHVIQKIV